MGMALILAQMGLLGLPLPEAGRLADFLGSWEAEQQAERCQAHLKYLKHLRGVCGYQDGRWEVYQEQTQFHLDYWQALQVCHMAEGDRAVSQRLGYLERLIGADNFKKNWHPPLLPEPRPPPEANPAGANGAQS